MSWRHCSRQSIGKNKTLWKVCINTWEIIPMWKYFDFGFETSILGPFWLRSLNYQNWHLVPNHAAFSRVLPEKSRGFFGAPQIIGVNIRCRRGFFLLNRLKLKKFHSKIDFERLREPLFFTIWFVSFLLNDFMYTEFYLWAQYWWAGKTTLPYKQPQPPKGSEDNAADIPDYSLPPGVVGPRGKQENR